MTGMQHVLLALCVKIDSGHCPFNLVETNIIKALKTRARYSSHAMVRNEEILLPPHEDMLALCKIPIGEIRFLCLSG